MYVLGINSTWHDSAACLVRDGKVLAAAEEERFTGVKHHKTWGMFNTAAQPFHAIDYCLGEAGIALTDVDHIAYAADPLLYPFLRDSPVPAHIDRPLNPMSAVDARLSEELWWTIYLSGMVQAPSLLIHEVPWHLRARWKSKNSEPALADPSEATLDREEIEKRARRRGHDWRFHWVEHHLAHAASAFLPSPYERAAILTLDGAGEVVSTLMAVGRGTAMETLQRVDLPHSLGKLYETVTTHLGFLSNSDEYKVMALASYGKPVHLDGFRSMVRWDDDGRYEIDDTAIEELCGPRRARNSPIEQRHFDIAASAQTVLEESCLRLANWLHAKTGEENLCLAGGVALNCVMNSRLLNESPFRRVWIQPAGGDAGTALGAALSVWHEQSDQSDRWQMRDAYLGPEYDADEIERALQHAKLRYERCSDIAAAAAECLTDGKIIGWFQGRMEFGPRALGARSILASPSDPDMVRRLNKLKDREDFRPVAPAVLEEAAGEYFENCGDAPFMTFVFRVREDKADLVPAIRHVDGTARVQTVSAESAPLYHRLIDSFRARTGLPVVVNTSFNSRGLPIVCTPQDALECFYISPIDALAIGDFLLTK
jgi:carbamoyltransferase